jgi:hypothetical protein
MPDCGGVPGTQGRALHLVGDLTALQILDDPLCVLVIQVVEVQPKHMSHARLQDPEAMYPVVSGGGRPVACLPSPRDRGTAPRGTDGRVLDGGPAGREVRSWQLDHQGRQLKSTDQHHSPLDAVSFAPLRPVQTAANAGLGRGAPAGASSTSIDPNRCHPTAASQVRGATTGDSAIIAGTTCLQPLNHAAEERGSKPPTPRICFRQFCRT